MKLCKKGLHELLPENMYQGRCKDCHREYQRKYQAMLVREKKQPAEPMTVGSCECGNPKPIKAVGCDRCRELDGM